MPDGGDAAAANAPAMSSTAPMPAANATTEGLGNFKGVMLCNPPERDLKGATNLVNDGDNGGGPMKAGAATSSLDPLGYGTAPTGLNPCHNRTARPPPKSIEHRKWIKELQKEVQAQKANCAGASNETDIDKFTVTKRTFDKQRADVDNVLTNAIEQGTTCLDDQFQDDLYDAVDIKRKAVNSKKRQEKRLAKMQKKIKPAWALTEEDATNRLDDEAEDLLNFASSLDYDSYIADVEFKQALGVLKDRASAIDRGENAFKTQLVDMMNAMEKEEDEEDMSPTKESVVDSEVGPSASEIGQLRGTALFDSEGYEDYDDDGSEDFSSDASSDFLEIKAGGRAQSSRAESEWTAGTDVSKAATEDSRVMAAEILEMNPAMKAVHSKNSLKQIIDKAEEIAAAMKELNKSGRGGALINPRIVTSTDLPAKKRLDPSKIAYLYRSPAI